MTSKKPEPHQQPRTLTASLIRPEDVARLAQAPALDRINNRLRARHPHLR